MHDKLEAHSMAREGDGICVPNMANAVGYYLAKSFSNFFVSRVESNGSD